MRIKEIINDIKDNFLAYLCFFLIFFLPSYFIYKIYDHNTRFDPTPTKKYNLSIIDKNKNWVTKNMKYHEYRDLCLKNIVSMNDCLPLLVLVRYKVRDKLLGHVQNWKKCFDLKLQKAMEKARLDKKCKTLKEKNISKKQILQSLEKELISPETFDECIKHKSSILKKIIDIDMYDFGKFCDTQTQIK